MKQLLFVMMLSQAVLAFSQDIPLVIQGKNRLQDEVITDLILDSEKYQRQRVILKDVTWVDFGFNGREVSFFQSNPWFKQSGTYGFQKSSLMQESDFTFWFQPSDQVSKRLALQMAGKYYTAPRSLNITGRYYYHQIPYGPSVHLFLVEEFTLAGVTYKGSIPDRVTE